MANAVLFLRSDERKCFDALKEELKDGWEIKEEKIDAYESNRQLKMRYSMADFSAFPKARELADGFLTGKAPKEISLADFPDDILKELAFVLGARGIGALMGTILSEIKDDNDIEALAVLGELRHDLLSRNSATFRR